jgi:Replication-relaxation
MGGMECLRLPRFCRAPDSIRVMELTSRDEEIVRLVSQHRFLRSNQITTLIRGSPQQLLRRLQLLFHHGYLDRPRSQLAYFDQGGSRSIVYGLGNKGEKIVAGLAETRPRFDWNDRNQSVKQLHLQHTLLISDVMVALEKACTQNGNARLVREDELAARINLRDPFRWTVNVRSLRLGLRPDKAFGLDNTKTGEKTFYFLEADRGTMPVSRRSLGQSSFHRKLLAYEATWKQNIHRTRFGFHRFRVLTVTTSPDRVKHLTEAARQLERGHGLFLFADMDFIGSQPDLLSLEWQTATGNTASLLA